jgi:hypothetical protein
MLQMPGEIDKQSEAKKRIIKLILLHVCGDIDIDSSLIANINPATPSRDMPGSLESALRVRASQFADLMQMTLNLAK